MQIGEKSITHGLGGRNVNKIRNNARLGAVVGELCRNAIPINGLKNAHNVQGTYAMVAAVNSVANKKTLPMIAVVTVEQQHGNVQSIEYVDVTHAVSGRTLKTDEKMEDRSAQGTSPGTKSEWTSQSSNITIAELLEVVNSTHRSILSNSVLEHFNL